MGTETTGTDTIRYLHGLDLVAQSDGVSAEYFAYDGLGSVKQVLDAAGLPLLTQTFDPYGNPYRYAGPTESVTSFGYSGEQTDSNGLVFLRARYYNPAQGRFGQMDPSRQERNPYLYANDNPINNVDPTGLQSEPTCSSGYEWYCLLMSILAPGQPAAPPTGPLTYPGNPGDPYLNPPQYPQWPVANPGTQPLNPVPTTPMLPWYTALPGTLGGWFSACAAVAIGLVAFVPTPVPAPYTPPYTPIPRDKIRIRECVEGDLDCDSDVEWLYRTMKADGGRPKIGYQEDELGARVPTDIKAHTLNGQLWVLAEGKGISAAPHPSKLHPAHRPIDGGGKSHDPLWCIPRAVIDGTPKLVAFPNSANHISIAPSEAMLLDDYQSRLANTQLFWQLAPPSPLLCDQVYNVSVN